MLASGTRVGPYEVISWLGAGGMGEVYRARDTKLHREVALKTLPPDLAGQPERLARLKQEARILASLNHPGIATLHGLEESDGGLPVLVMELVEGESLAESLRRGALPWREAVIVAHQIALALEAAHEKGVLHRDLKPANIRLAPEGRVKLLDFGLAKAVRKAAVDSRLDTDTSPHSDAGAVLGTAPYMSPEQARGQEADRRGDIWAFGCVLFEMLAGKRAFAGATFSDTVAAVLDRDPDWPALPPETPLAVVRLLRRCLQKERDRRLRDVGDVRLELEDLLAGPAPRREPGESTVIARPPRTSWLGGLGSPWFWLIVGAVAMGAGLWALGNPRPSPERSVVRLAISLPSPEAVARGYASEVAVSPDGTQLAYVAAREGHTQIYVRTLDRLESRPIRGTEDGDAPFFSSDGRWLGFYLDGEHKLKKVPLSGGAALTVCEVGNARGASWGPDGTIVFTRDAASGLLRVSADGGTPQVLTALDANGRETSHRLPAVLPGGEGVVFTVNTAETLSWDDARIEAVSFRTRERSVLIPGGTNARYSGGHLIYERTGGLWAAPFDPAQLKVTGPSAPVLEGVSSSVSYGSVDFDVSRDGSLVYVPGSPRGGDRRLVRVDRSGRRRPVTEVRRAFESISLSPDGRRLALALEAANDQIWVYDLDRSTLTPQTLAWTNSSPIWTPDGRRLTFTSNRGGPFNLFWQPADGSGPAEPLDVSGNWQAPYSWTPDGKTLVFQVWWPSPDIWTLTLDGDRKPRPLLQGRFNEFQAALSPNGHWLAYVSNESGRDEIYVRLFPGAEGRWPISTDGGYQPVWARNGRELFYLSGGRMMAVSVTSDGTFTARKPMGLFEAKGLLDMPSYDVTPDGEFLMIESGESDSSPPTRINVVLNWLQEVRQRVAGK
jgi:eukaryotic-like serine/threonine-protein kinase